MKKVKLCGVADVGGVAAVGFGMQANVGPGGGVKTPRLIVSSIDFPRPIAFRY